MDYNGLRAVPFFIRKNLDDKIPNMGRNNFYKDVIIPNQQNLKENDRDIPDMDCLYYKSVSGIQHLFIRLSSTTRKLAELAKRNCSNNTLNAGNNNVYIAGNHIKTDHAKVAGRNIVYDAKDTIYNKASQMTALDTILMRSRK